MPRSESGNPNAENAAAPLKLAKILMKQPTNTSSKPAFHGDVGKSLKRFLLASTRNNEMGRIKNPYANSESVVQTFANVKK